MTPLRDQQSVILSLLTSDHIQANKHRLGVLGASDLNDAIAMLETALTTHDEAREHLGNLLAIIHGDGGHYQAEHGNEKATTDAIAKYYELRAKHDEALPGDWTVELILDKGDPDFSNLYAICVNGLPKWSVQGFHVATGIAAAHNSAMRVLVDALRQHQEWMEEDGMRSDGVPMHDCDFALAPESGTCSFHELYAATVEALQPYSGQKP